MDVAAATIFRISWEAWRELGAEFDPDAARPSVTGFMVAISSRLPR